MTTTTFGTFTRGDEKRVAFTVGEAVQLRYDGWQEQQPAKSLDELTVPELRQHADAHGVDLAGATKKPEILARLEQPDSPTTDTQS